MTKRKAFTIRIVIYIAVYMLPVGMLIGTLNAIKQLNNHQVETITFSSIRHVEADSDYYLIKDINDREFEIETHYKKVFRYEHFTDYIEVGDKLTITYISKNTVLEIKSETATYLNLSESTRLLNQSNISFLIISLILFVLIAVTEVYDYGEWIKSDAYKELK
ncbi:Uncharacterised protein [Acholeplasma oculi]|uniref:hypothetical protein n=1 Tax=Acholeplasma oculi TaxID=35623 RepID=UPI0005F2DB15|nr:hypothetical protein [Acholeplasma oculi]SKC35713.1 hypothetical protein SAMN02745122_0299 [Acholeplasma oculi]SUT90252.1 Uncharacterised protein [Acholeplasma oculi]